jgi:hypothetical protein
MATLHIRAYQLHAEFVADAHDLKTALPSSFNGRMHNTIHVPLSDAPVTMASNCSPIPDSSGIAAVDFSTCRLTFSAASSSSVQCFASASNCCIQQHSKKRRLFLTLNASFSGWRSRSVGNIC